MAMTIATLVLACLVALVPARRPAVRGNRKIPRAAAGDVALGAALKLVELQHESGAPLDVLLTRYVRSHTLRQAERRAVSSYLDETVRCHARLDARLRDAGVEATPRARLLASLRLCSKPESEANAMAAAAQLATAAELSWLTTLAPPLETDAMAMASRLECPEWAWPRFERAFGEDVSRELRALQTAAPVDLRVNTLKATREEALLALRDAGYFAEPPPLSPVGIRLGVRRVRWGRLPGLREGIVEPQDEASQLVALLVGARPGESIVDFCAGAGGKTLALASEMCNRGQLVAMDVDESRLLRGVPRVANAGVDTVEHHVIAPGPMDAWLEARDQAFDRVLVDAPCSGVGAWRRNPDARWLRKTRGIDELLPLQADVLRRASRLVKPGGVLVYATCSVLLEENDEQVAAFLASEHGADFELRPPEGFHAPLEPSGCLQLTPARHGCDGLFGAVLARRL